mmetsp:Transcript_22507/g.49712  ORF Transcript_22507/g.49712 Transcript_22507/m.49712 type:complete len:350 (+) Transcript_22507:1296-2345(+)
MMVERADDPVEASNGGLVHHRRDQVRCVDDESRSLSLPSLDVLSQRIVALSQGPRLVLVPLSGGGLLQLEFLFVKILEANLLDAQELQKAGFHLLLVPQSVVAQDQVEACHEVEMLSSVHQKVLVRVDGVWELVHLEECMANVAHDLESDSLNIVRNLIQSHTVHLDGSGPLLLLEVDVAHINPEAATGRVLLVLHDLRVYGQSLVVVVICLVLDGQVETHSIGEIHIELVEQILLLSQPTQLSLLFPGLLPLLERLSQVPLLAGDGALLYKPVDLLFHFSKLLLGRQFRLLLQRLGSTSSIALVHRVEDFSATLLGGSSVPSSSIRSHRSSGLGICASASHAAAGLRH